MITANLGKSGPNIRQKYFKKRKAHLVKGNKKERIMKDIDHKISKKIVDYAFKNKLKIVVEDLKGIRKTYIKGNGSKAKNRFANSWSLFMVYCILVNAIVVQFLVASMLLTIRVLVNQTIKNFLPVLGIENTSP